MKKSLVFISVLTFFALTTFAQKAEVLYFKANLACCAAKACSNIEGQVKAVVEKNFNANEVVFKSIMIADSANTELVNKYSAKSQTVVVVQTKKKKALNKDVSDLVKNFSRSRDEAAFEKDFVAAIKELL